MPRPLVSLLAALAACTTMDGTMEGEDVRGAQDAFYDTELYQIGAFRYRIFAVLVTSAYDGCEGLEALEEAEGTCSILCGDLHELALEHLTGDTLWTLSLLFATTTEVEQDYEWNDATSEASFSASLTRTDTTALFDPEACEELCGEDRQLMPSESWTATGGSGTIKHWKEDEGLRGRYEATFRHGEVEGRFDASFCPGMFWQ